MINVFLTDDHQMFLDGLEAILKEDQQINIVGMAIDGKELLTRLEESEDRVDVTVLDIKMPKLNGIEAAKEIVEKYPNMKILVISMHKEKNYIMNLMEIGVSGYILKNKSKENLINAIHQVHAGNPYFGLDVLAVASERREKKEPTESLTRREIEVLCKIAEGYTTNEIAKQLEIGATTVITYRRNLLFKLDKKNDKHLVRYAIKNGYVDL